MRLYILELCGWKTYWLFLYVVIGGNDLQNFRVTGVLQRFSISYMVIACLQCYVATPERHTLKTMVGIRIFYVNGKARRPYTFVLSSEVRS